MSGAMGSGQTRNPDTSGPSPETGTGATGTANVSEVEIADICSGLKKKAKVSRSGAECPEAGCGLWFTKVANANRHCVRFHRIHLYGTPASEAEVAKLTEQVKSSDRRRLEAKKLASTSSGAGPVVKARRTEKRSEKRSISTPPIPPGFQVSKDSDTVTDDRSAHCDSPDQPDPDPPMIWSRKPERTQQSRRRARKASTSPSEKLGSQRSGSQPGLLECCRSSEGRLWRNGTMAPLHRCHVWRLSESARRRRPRRLPMLWNFSGAPVDQISLEAAIANRWSPCVAREAR